ncbi:MAG: DUF3793 family protein [Oscillospiraceae bacterium]
MLVWKESSPHPAPGFERGTFEHTVAFHGAPVLLGIKPAGLFTFDHGNARLTAELVRFNKKAAAKGLAIRTVCSCRKKMLLYLYHEQKLDAFLRTPAAADLLEKFGYTADMTLAEKLDRLVSRIEGIAEFPHESGVFLGYPPEDVQGFIDNGGRNYKLCGAWKVYGDERHAARMFKNYGKCRRHLCAKLAQGMSIYEALKIA